MIIIYFLLDFLVMMICPFNTYFVINDIDNNKFIYLVIVIIGVYFIYGVSLVYLVILLGMYLVVRLFKVKSKYYYIKNIILFIIYYNLMFFVNGYDFNYYMYLFMLGGLFQIVLIILSKKLLK